MFIVGNNQVEKNTRQSIPFNERRETMEDETTLIKTELISFQGERYKDEGDRNVGEV